MHTVVAGGIMWLVAISIMILPSIGSYEPTHNNIICIHPICYGWKLKVLLKVVSCSDFH